MQIYSATELADLRMYGSLRLHYDKLGTGARIGNMRLPNFKANNEMYTKTTPTRSDEEILKAVAELAKKHAEMAKEAEKSGKKYNFFQNADNEFLDLHKEFISSASPDRESILTNSLNEIFKKASLPRKETGDALSIKDSLNKSLLQQTLQIMEQMKNKNVPNNKIWRDGEISGALYNVGIMKGNDLEYAQFFDSSGFEIAKYNNGWRSQLTNEEQVRRKEFLDVYNDAYNSAYKAQEATLPKSVDCGNSFDVVG